MNPPRKPRRSAMPFNRTGAVLCLLTLACAPAGRGGISQTPQAREGVLDLRAWDFTRDGIVELGGDWAFHWKRTGPVANLAPTAFGPINRSWNTVFGERHPEITTQGYATYRLVLKMAPTAEERLFGLRVSRTLLSLVVRVDGREILRQGRPGTSPDSTVEHAAKAVAYFAVPAERREIVIEALVANYADPRGGGDGKFHLGLPERMEAFNRRSAALDWLTATGLFFFGIYHLGMFVIRRRENRAALFFGLLCLTISFRALISEEALLLDIAPRATELFWRGGYLTYALGVCIVVFYVESLFEWPRVKWLLRLVGGIGLGFAVLSMVPAADRAIVLRAGRAFHVLALVSIALLIVSSLRALLARRPGSAIFFSGFLLVSGAAIHDILANFGLFNSPAIFTFALMGFIASQALLIYQRFSTAFASVESLSEELGRTNQELTILAGVKDEFMANLSHELRTPLTLIRGSTEMIEMRAGEDAILLKSTGRIKEGSDLLIDYLDDMMLLTDMETLADVSMGPVDAESLVRGSVEQCRELAVRMNVSVHIESGGSSMVFGNERLLGRGLRNLVKNGIVFNQPGGSVLVRTENGPGGPEIIVRDNGRGIPPDRIDRVFEKFFRVNPLEHGGVGLGLFLTRRIVDLHGGKIHLESALDHGTTVTVELRAAGSPGRAGEGEK